MYIYYIHIYVLKIAFGLSIEKNLKASWKLQSTFAGAIEKGRCVLKALRCLTSGTILENAISFLSMSFELQCLIEF